MDLQNSTAETERTKFTTSTPACKIRRFYNKMAEYILNVSDSFSFESEKTSTASDDNKSSVDIFPNLSNGTVHSSKSDTSNDEAMISNRESINDKSTSYEKSSILFEEEANPSLNILENCDNELCTKSDSSSAESDKNTPEDESSKDKNATVDSGLNVFGETLNVSESYENLTGTDSTSLTSLEDGASSDKKLYTNIAKEAIMQRHNIENTLNDFGSIQDSLEDNLATADVSSTSSLKDIDSSKNENPCNEIATETTEPAQKTDEYNIEDEDYLLSDNLDDACSTPDSLEEDLLMADSPVLSCFEDAISNDESSCLPNESESSDSTELEEKHNEDDNYLLLNSLRERGNIKETIKENLSTSDKDYDSFCFNGFVSNNKNPDPNNANKATKPTQKMEKQNTDDDYLFSDTLKEFGSTPDLPEEILSTSNSPISHSPKISGEHMENSAGTHSLQERSDSSSGNKSPYRSFKDLSSVQNLSTLRKTSSENYTKHLNFCNSLWKVSENTNDTSTQGKHFGSSSENNSQTNKDSRDVATVSNNFSSENYTKHFKFSNFKWSESNNMKDTSVVSNDASSENNSKRLKFCDYEQNDSESKGENSEEDKNFENNVENSSRNYKDSFNVFSPGSNDASSEKYPKRAKFSDFKWSESDNIKDISTQVENFGNNAENSYQNGKDSLNVIAKVLNTVSSENYPKHLKFRDFKWNESDKKTDTSAQFKHFGKKVETLCQNDKVSSIFIAPGSNVVCNTDIGLTGSDILNFELSTQDKNSEYLAVANIESKLPNDENANSPKEQIFRISENPHERNFFKQMNSTSDNFLQINPVLESRLIINHDDCINETIAKEATQSAAKYEYPDSPMNVETDNLKDVLELSGTLVQEATPKEHLFDITTDIVDQSDKESSMEVDNNCTILSKTNEDNSFVIDCEMTTDSGDADLTSPQGVISPESIETDILDAKPGPSSGGIAQNSFNLVSYRNMLKKHFIAKIDVEKSVKRALLSAKNNRNKGLTLNQILKFISKNKLLAVHSKIDQDVLKYLEEAQKLNVLKFEKGKYIIGNQKKKNSTVQKIKQVLQNKMPSMLQNKKSYSLRSKASYSLRSKIDKKNLKINAVKTPKSNELSKKTPQSQIKNPKKTPQSAKGSVFKKLRSRTVLKKK